MENYLMENYFLENYFLENYFLENLPFNKDIETKTVLKKLSSARAALAELKGVSATVPNVGILLNNSLYKKPRTVPLLRI